MWSFWRWRVTTWLIVAWSGFWAYVAVSMTWSTFDGTACARSAFSTPASCQGWIGYLLAGFLFMTFQVWRVGTGVLILLWAIGWRRKHSGSGEH